MKKYIASILRTGLLCWLLAAGSLYAQVSVVRPGQASYAERLAAREVRRYLYLRTGQWLEITVDQGPAEGQRVIVGRKDRPMVQAAAEAAGCVDTVRDLTPQGYMIKTCKSSGRTVLLIAGGDDRGVLYGAYRFAEHLGVRFYMHGDVYPDEYMPLELPEIDQQASPLFETRGIQPFHDFPEGPDWWNLEDYKAIISQLPKMGMNFIGFHTYPQGGVGPEPMVWIGPAEQIKPDGTVSTSYPSRHFTTHSGTWGYDARDTGQYHYGASQIYEYDAFGADYMIGRTPWPEGPEECNAVFNEFGTLLNEALSHCRRLGIKTCIGTETPLIIPDQVKQRLIEADLDPASPEVVRKMYEGMFRRIMACHPLDYYWFWTPEGWTWHGVSEEQVQATINDLELAIAAAEAVEVPFTLATCGWVLGPPTDRSLFDNILPKEMPMSCINRMVGKEPVEPGFADVQGRPKWAIPWLEDDPALTAPQLWAGRMRRDAFDAKRYGCTGLMGIHWRTRILGPNVRALALAAWDQAGWSEEAAQYVQPPAEDCAVEGSRVTYNQSPIDKTEEDPAYQSVLYNMKAYKLLLPDGVYTVTLKFCEPHYGEKGKRVFGVKLQGKQVIEHLDMFARAGKNTAIDYTFHDIKVDDGLLDIDFVYEFEFPCIAGIVVQGDGVTRKINCGGLAYEDYQADLPTCPAMPRDLPVDDFYRDWAGTQFGFPVADAVGKIFSSVDGKHPQPSAWVEGPGHTTPMQTPWEERVKVYAFVDQLAALREQVKGAGNLERFDYWLNSFRYMRAMDHLRCVWGQYEKNKAPVEAEKDAEKRKKMAGETLLPIRKRMIERLEEVYKYLLATISNTGEMGNLTNWEQHILPDMLEAPGRQLEEWLGEPLAAEYQPGNGYIGPMRIILSTPRTSLDAGEDLLLRVRVFAADQPKKVRFHWRSMGQKQFAVTDAEHVGRHVYRVTLSDDRIAGRDFEYFLQAVSDEDTTIHYPVTAPKLNQTVVVVE